MSKPTLAQTQTLLWKLITAPEGVGPGLQVLPAQERAVASALVRATPPMSAVERCDIYANMYFFRLRDCLREDYTAVAALVGDAAFHNLVTDYLLAHPPSHFSLRYAGEHLAEFLVRHELSDSHPYLADVARLEYAILDSFDAADAAPLTAEHLRRIPVKDWAGMRLMPAPAVRLLTLRFPVADIWRAAKEGRMIASPAASASHMRVWRRNHRVFHKTIAADEAAALAALLQGATFAEICDVLEQRGGENTGAAAALDLLQSWLAEEVLSTDVVSS